MEVMNIVLIRALQFLIAQMLRELLEPLDVEQGEKPLVESQLANERQLRLAIGAALRLLRGGSGRGVSSNCIFARASARHYRPSSSNMRRWKSSSISRTF